MRNDESKLDFYAKVRSITSYINEEIKITPTSQKTRERVQSICNTISSEILSNIEKLDDEELIDGLDQQLLKFYLLIREMKKDESERIAFVMLIKNVADLLSLMNQENR